LVWPASVPLVATKSTKSAAAFFRASIFDTVPDEFAIEPVVSTASAISKKRSSAEQVPVALSAMLLKPDTRAKVVS
jgi:hypothetical protein